MSIPWMQEAWTQNMTESRFLKPLMKEGCELHAVVVMCAVATLDEQKRMLNERRWRYVGDGHIKKHYRDQEEAEFSWA